MNRIKKSIEFIFITVALGFIGFILPESISKGCRWRQWLWWWWWFDDKNIGGDDCIILNKKRLSTATLLHILERSMSASALHQLMAMAIFYFFSKCLDVHLIVAIFSVNAFDNFCARAQIFSNHMVKRTYCYRISDDLTGLPGMNTILSPSSSKSSSLEFR